MVKKKLMSYNKRIESLVFQQGFVNYDQQKALIRRIPQHDTALRDFFNNFSSQDGHAQN